jgi:hypothetical protein
MWDLRFSWWWLRRMPSSGIWHHVALVRTNVLEGHIASIIRVERISSQKMAFFSGNTDDRWMDDRIHEAYFHNLKPRWQYLLTTVWEEVYTLGNKQRHASSSHAAHSLQEYLPRLLIFWLSPSVWPAEDYSIGLHTSQTCCLDSKHRTYHYSFIKFIGSRFLKCSNIQAQKGTKQMGRAISKPK